MSIVIDLKIKFFSGKNIKSSNIITKFKNIKCKVEYECLKLKPVDLVRVFTLN